MIECLDCGTPMEDIIWEKHHGKCKERQEAAQAA